MEIIPNFDEWLNEALDAKTPKWSIEQYRSAVKKNEGKFKKGDRVYLSGGIKYKAYAFNRVFEHNLNAFDI